MKKMIDGTSPRLSRPRRMLRLVIHAARQRHHDWQTRRMEQIQIQRLNALDDSLLKDIGPTRSDVPDAVRFGRRLRRFGSR
jgi:uncharacterized protein YjiS (DUF1127 family)